MISCTNCGTENDAGRKFCVACGTRLASPCAVCGTVNPLEARFCGECGNPLPEPRAQGPDRAASPPGAASASESAGGPSAGVAERRLVSVLFVDLVGFTSASERRDAEDTRELLSRYYEAARDIVRRHGGVIEKFIGDAVMAVWGTPTAHEDDAERAVRSAFELVAAVPRLSPDGLRLQARAGVLTGEAAVTIGAESEGMVAGDLVNTASRLQSVAEPGTVLVGESTYRAASLAIAFEPAGERELKGKERPVAVWRAKEVIARRGGEGRAAVLEPPFVGRDDELQLLKDLFHATAREGKPRLVTVAGQAGMGKSRLIWELEKYLDGVVETVFWHAGRSPAYGEGISYWALAEMIRSRAGISDGEDQSTARERLVEMLREWIPDEEERRWIEPRMGGLLGLEELPQETREQQFAAWRTLLERVAARAPVVLTFLDLQWADQGTLDFIEHLLAWARTSPILVLAEARPELFDRRPGWGTGVRSATLIHLEPLGDGDMQRLLLGLVPTLPEPALRRIVTRAEGVPLYAVETLRMLVDLGSLQPEGRQYRLVGELPDLAVPETLHALIAARLDALSADDRELITDGAVLGLSFSVAAVVAMADRPSAATEERLDGLVRRELLLKDVDPRSPERGQYRFVQAVVREVAYQSLSKRTRQARHLAAARYFEALGEDELAGVLATHYVAAHDAAPAGPQADALAAQAKVALRAAAERATALHDLLGALDYLDRALLVTAEPSEQAAVHERAAAVAADAARTPEAYAHAQSAEAIYASLGDRLGVLRSRSGQATIALSEHADRRAVSILEAALAEVGDLPPSEEIAYAESELARAMMLAGSPEAITWADRVLAHPGVVAPLVLLETLVTKGTALANLGRAAEAEVTLRGAIAVADGQGNVAAGLRARNNLRVQLEGFDLRDALALGREVEDIAVRFGLRTWVLQAVGSVLNIGFLLGSWEIFEDRARAELPDAPEWYAAWFTVEAARRRIYDGDPAAAVRAVEASLALESVRNSVQATTWNLATKADGLIALGRYDEAFEIARSAWNATTEAIFPLETALFSATAAGRPALIPSIGEASRAMGIGRWPIYLALEAMAGSLEALLTGRWDDGRAAYNEARRGLEATGDQTVLARLQLAVGHLAAGRFPEAGEAMTAAERFFGERGAPAYVAAYRASAARPTIEATGLRQRTAPAVRAAE